MSLPGARLLLSLTAYGTKSTSNSFLDLARVTNMLLALYTYPKLDSVLTHRLKNCLLDTRKKTIDYMVFSFSD